MGTSSMPPPRSAGPAHPPVLVVAALIVEDRARLSNPQNSDHVLLVRRGPQDAGAGFWEFPGGKVDPGETHLQALRREIEEELGVEISIGESLGRVFFSYPEKNIELHVYWSQISSGEIELREHDAMKWVLPSEIKIDELSLADRPFVVRIEEFLSRLEA